MPGPEVTGERFRREEVRVLVGLVLLEGSGASSARAWKWPLGVMPVPISCSKAIALPLHQRLALAPAITSGRRSSTWRKPPRARIERCREGERCLSGRQASGLRRFQASISCCCRSAEFGSGSGSAGRSSAGSAAAGLDVSSPLVLVLTGEGLLVSSSLFGCCFFFICAPGEGSISAPERVGLRSRSGVGVLSLCGVRTEGESSRGGMPLRRISVPLPSIVRSSIQPSRARLASWRSIVLMLVQRSRASLRLLVESCTRAPAL
jgi:hypothetical protein